MICKYGSDPLKTYLPNSDIDITLKVQKIWDDRNLGDEDGLDMGMAYPLI